ncbi:MAG: DUF1365 family protein [Acidobacteriota bacterium]
MKSIAIIGSGIAGLGCAHRLYRDFDITLFDRNGYAGGHTNTVDVHESGRKVPIDTGFMVYNEVTYPNLTQLFRELDVATKPAPMSFSVQDLGAGIEYGGSSVSQLFAQRRNALNPRFLRTLMQISRFNKEAEQALEDDRFERMTLQHYSEARGYGEDFLRLYLLPMSSAVWSTPFDEVREFPALTLLRFFRNHGLLGGLSGQHQWRTVTGGAKSYVEKMTRPFREHIRLGVAVAQVERDADGATLQLEDGSSAQFDKVIFACHADEGLALLVTPTAEERRLLGAFRYQENVAVLHTDRAPMPRSRRAWASWNYRVDTKGMNRGGRRSASTVYWMNSLQGVSDRQDYFVSIDDPGLIDERRVIKTIRYHHPMFNLGAIDAQRSLPSLNELGPDQTTYFCGSYFRYGFHEDAFTSALDTSAQVARAASRGWSPYVLTGGASASTSTLTAGEPEEPVAASALYECTITHERFSPTQHRFSYRVFAFSLDLDELGDLVARIPWLSRNRFNLFSFFDRDHLQAGYEDVRSNLVALLKTRGITQPIGRIQLVTNLRMLGYVFNPVSFYFCFDVNGRPLAAVAEVNNTFGETKAYVLDRSELRGTATAATAVFESRQRKEFYISPFSDLDIDLRMRLAVPAERLGIVIDDMSGHDRILTAAMSGRRVPLTATRLAWFAVKYPLLTLRVIAAIHWHAIRLWLKGTPLRRKADDPHLQRGIIGKESPRTSPETKEAGER